MNILVVDDQPEYRILLADLLQDEGWHVCTAEDGDSALRAMAKVKMDLVVTDIYMPLMDGFKFRQTVRAIAGYQKLPIIFVSAHDDAYTVTAVKDPDCETFLSKSTLPDRLLEWIHYLTSAHGTRMKPRINETNFGFPRPHYSFAL